MLSIRKSPEMAIIALLCLTSNGFAQSPTATSDQAKAAFASKSPIGTVTLDGTFSSTEGSLRQEGNAHLVAGSDGTYSVALTKNTGATGEDRRRTDSDMGCTWRDARGNDHPVDWSNCQTPAWFMPELPIFASSQPTPEWALSLQTAGQSALHLKVNYIAPVDKRNGVPSPVSGLDLELTGTTMLPAKASFVIHAEGHPNINIPVEIQYDDYRQVSGVSIPFHIRKFVNGTLVLSITVGSANVN